MSPTAPELLAASEQYIERSKQVATALLSDEDALADIRAAREQEERGEPLKPWSDYQAERAASAR